MKIFSSQLLYAPDDLHGYKVWTTPGTYTLKLPRRTKAKITVIGSGNDRHKFVSTTYGTTTYWYAGNGGGAFIGGVILPAGVYSIKVGNSYHSTYYDEINQRNQDMAYINPTSLTHNTIGELLSVTDYVDRSANLEIQYGTVEMEQDGNLAISDNGGASLWNGYGKGSDKNASNYTTGYFSIEW